jgi:hypothetical protein
MTASELPVTLAWHGPGPGSWVLGHSRRALCSLGPAGRTQNLGDRARHAAAGSSLALSWHHDGSGAADLDAYYVTGVPVARRRRAHWQAASPAGHRPQVSEHTMMPWPGLRFGS